MKDRRYDSCRKQLEERTEQSVDRLARFIHDNILTWSWRLGVWTFFHLKLILAYSLTTIRGMIHFHPSHTTTLSNAATSTQESIWFMTNSIWILQCEIAFMEHQ